MKRFLIHSLLVLLPVACQAQADVRPVIDANIKTSAAGGKITADQLRTTLNALADSKMPVVTADQLRNLPMSTTPPRGVYIIDQIGIWKGPGVYLFDPADLSSADNGFDVIISSTGKRYKRVVPGFLHVRRDSEPQDETGGVLIQGNAHPKRRLYLGLIDQGNYGLIQMVESEVDWRPLVLNLQGGNVGVGTSTPAQKLHVAGSLLFRRTSGAGAPTTATLPTDGDSILWKNTTSGETRWYTNDSGTIKSGAAFN